MEALGLQDTYVGSSAQALRGILAISQPLKGGTVQDWDDLEAIWQHVYSRELGVSASDLPALVTLPPLATRQEESTMAEILVEKLGVPAPYLANKAVMSLYGGGQMTGVAVDSGQDTTYIVPSYQGNPIQDATLVLKVGGRQVTEHLMTQLMNGKYSFPDDNFLLWRKKKKTKFTVSSKKETFLAPEIMFQPSLANKKSCGLSQLIYYSVLKCDESIRSELVNNITLSGGNTKFPGFEKRLYQELAELFDEKTNIKVRALPNRDLLGWVGAARLSNLSSFQRFWLTKADYQENGPVMVHDNSKIFEDIKNSNAEVKAA